MSEILLSSLINEGTNKNVTKKFIYRRPVRPWSSYILILLFSRVIKMMSHLIIDLGFPKKSPQDLGKPQGNLSIIWMGWCKETCLNFEEWNKSTHFFFIVVEFSLSFPGGSVVNNPPSNAGDASWIAGSGRSPGEGNSNPLQYSCLGYFMGRGAWQATVCGLTKELDTTTEWLNKNNTKISL